MAISEKISGEVLGWIALAVVIVVGSIVLLQIKGNNISNITCPGLNSSHTFFNSSANTCCVASGNCASPNSSAIGSTAQTIDTFVTGLSEPQNWVAIVLIAIIGGAVLLLFMKKRK